MITEALFRFFVGAVDALLSFIPPIVTPDWLTSAVDGVSSVFGYAGLMGAWFPVTLVRNVVLGVLAMWMIGFGMKVIRIVLSFFTAGGGSAG